MKKWKKAFALVTMLVTISALSAVAYAATDNVPASVQTDSLEERQAACLEAKKDILSKRVADGTMTQAEADQILTAILENQETCDGSGSARIGQKFGVGFGLGNGQGRGCGNRMGMGRGQGACGGACQAQ